MNEIIEKFDQLEENHKGGLKNLWQIYGGFDTLFKSRFFQFSLIFTFIFAIVSFAILKIDTYKILEKIDSLTLNIFPDILGFNIGGYVLLIGFNSTNILNEITSTEKNQRFSLFQKKSSVFAFSLLIQGITLLVAFLINIGILIFEDAPNCNLVFAHIVNGGIILILTFLSVYSVTLIIRVILNIFDFGQTLHFFVALENLEKQAETFENENEGESKKNN